MSNQSSDSTSHNYRPRSPDLSGFVAPPPARLNRLPSLPYQNPADSAFPQGYSFSPRGSYDASPYFSPQATQPLSYFGSQSQSQPSQSQSHPSQPFFSQPQPFSQSDNDQMARLRARNTRVNYNEDSHRIDEFDQTVNQNVNPIVQQQQQQSFSQFPPQPQSLTAAPPLMPQQPPFQQLQMQPLQQPQHPQHSQPLHPQNQPPPFQSIPTLPHQSTLPQIEIRTKFPVARIKRIMQADEDIGKVAQATPTAVAKALELFMIALVSKGSLNAKEQSSKRVTATHLKNALLSDSQFDFLNEICENVAEEGGGKRKKADGSAGGNKSEESDADEEIVGAGQKKKGRVRKKKGQSGDDSD